MIPIHVLSDKETSGVQMVFDYSGIAKSGNGGNYVNVIVVCGGILSVSMNSWCDRCRCSDSSAVWEGYVGIVSEEV